MEISIIMPTYNPPIKYLEKAIQSIINQTSEKFELIIILDGSNKITENICKKYKEKDKRIKIYWQKNKGEGGARNTKIEKATNEWITFIDPDDWLEKDAIEVMQECFKKTKSQKEKPDIIIFDTYINYKNKEEKNEFYTKEGILNNYNKKQIQLQNIEQGICEYYPSKCNVSVAWAKLYQKEFIIKNKIKFIEKIKRYTDTIFNINAFELAKNIEYYNKYIYHYRKNKYSITHNYYAEMKNDVKTYLKETKKYIKIYNKDSDFKQTYYISVITKITSYLEMSYKKINIKQELKQLKQEYKYELQNINKNKINIYQKLMLKNIEKEKIAGIKILITLHKIYLKI